MRSRFRAKPADHFSRVPPSLAQCFKSVAEESASMRKLVCGRKSSAEQTNQYLIRQCYKKQIRQQLVNHFKFAGRKTGVDLGRQQSHRFDGPGALKTGYFPKPSWQ
jgi:hypothetical protein